MSLDLFATVPTVNTARMNTQAPPHPFQGLVHLAPGQAAGRGEGSFDVAPYLGLIQGLTGIDLLQGEKEGVTRVPKDDGHPGTPYRMQMVPRFRVAQVAAALAEAYQQYPNRPPQVPQANGPAAERPGEESAQPASEPAGKAQNRPLEPAEWHDLVRFFQICAARGYAVTIILE